MKEFFGEDHVLNVATFSKTTSKRAIEMACKGLGIDDTEANYLKSLVPVVRGKITDLKTCLYGSKDGLAPVHTLASEMKKYDRLIDCCLGIEGLIANRGTHAAGVVVSNNPYIEYISAMRSADGTMETCYDLWDSEAAGLIKFDMLTVNAADKIHKTMDFLLEHGKITWEGSLKKTYYKWIHPDVINYDNKEMWEIIPKIYSLFQWDTPVSQKALSVTHPKSVMDLSAGNSLLRLMPDADEAPVDRYKRYKESHEAWVKDTTDYGLNDEERAILWTYLSDAYGLADSQEKVMRLSMDERVSGYTLKEANKLRKSIAKKDAKLQEEAKQLFFECCERQGTREVFADYIWNVVFAASFGYSFSQLHSYSYSIIALQELNLNYFYAPVYWNCACLSIEASGIEKEDDDKTGAVDYGEVAKAIYKMKQSNIEVSPPDINESDLNFTPVEATNSILYGISGISGINADISKQIIDNRPYDSFTDFLDKNTYKGSLITPTKIKTLIYGGCFDCFNPDRIKIMKQYISYTTPAVDSLTMANMSSIKGCGVSIPKEIVAPYNFYKYVTAKERLYGAHPTAKSKKLYWLDEKGKAYFTKNLMHQLKEDVDYWYEDDKLIVVDKSIEKSLKVSLDRLKGYINDPSFLKEYRRAIMRQKYMDFIDGNESVEHWSFTALSYYSHNHELYNLDYDKYLLTKFCKLPEEPNFVEMSTRGRTWRRYEINAICGTVLDVNKNKHIVTILTPEDDVVNCKFNAEHFAYYTRQITDGEYTEKPWLKRGNLVILTGYRRGENEFAVKRYKNTVYNSSVKLIHSVNSDGSAVLQSKRYGEEEDEKM